MRANPFVPALGRLVGSRGNPEDGLVRLLAKSGLGIALADRSLQAEHGLDEAIPRRTAEPRLGRKHRQFAGFPAVAAGGLALVRTGWLSSCGSQFKLTAQARLVVLDLGEQMIARGDHALERFFGRVSSVNTHPFKPSASISSGAAGISLLFSSTITWPSTI